MRLENYANYLFPCFDNPSLQEYFKSPVTRKPTSRKVGIAGRTETVERLEKIERSETVERSEMIEGSELVAKPGKIERFEAVERPGKIKSSEAAERPKKIERSETIERPETDKTRIYWMADPPESGEGGRKRTASRWYRTRHPDRVLPKEAVVP